MSRKHEAHARKEHAKLDAHLAKHDKGDGSGVKAVKDMAAVKRVSGGSVDAK